MQERCKIYDEPASVRSRLAQLGLTPEILIGSIEYGMGHKRDLSGFAPRILGGLLLWGMTIEELRSKLAPDGWVASSTKNFESVTSPDGETSIVVMGGDALTGVADEHKLPSNRNDKGSQTHLVVMFNRQMHLSEYRPDFGKPNTPNTWVLLHYEDEQAEEIRIELSLPFDYSNGFLKDWKERIILRSIPFDKGIDAGINDDEGDDDGDIVIPVIPRG